MSLTKQQALDLFHSDDLIGIGMEADAVRRRLHPEGTVTYIIDRNINYTNFCTEYCTFCAFYRPPGHAEGYVLAQETVWEKIRETIELGGTGVLMQGGLHPELEIEWYEDLLRSIKERFQIHLHCFSSPEILNIAEVSGLSLSDTIARLRDAGLDSIPGGGAWHRPPCRSRSGRRFETDPAHPGVSSKSPGKLQKPPQPLVFPLGQFVDDIAGEILAREFLAEAPLLTFAQHDLVQVLGPVTGRIAKG